MTDLARHRGDMIDSITLTGDIAPFRAEVDDENPAEVSIVWTEELAFHVDVRGLDLTVDGDLRPGVTDALQTELRRLLSIDEVYVQRSDQDDLAMEIVVGLTVEPATVERLSELAWPFVATLINVMDPGTFNAEYVMGNVARIIEEQA